jgi:hypothetical protein
MIRPIVVALALMMLLTGRAHAQSAPPDADDNRFSYNRVEDGYVRLDMRTGQVSLCKRRGAAWSCQLAPDDRIAFENEMARLQAENALLKKTLLDRGLSLPQGVKPEPPGVNAPDPNLKLPNDADVDRMMSFIEKIWRRLIEMMANLQRDLKGT